MSVIDPVADMLTRVRNACQAGHRRVDMPVSKLKVEIARLLRDNHYVQDFKVLDDGRHGLLRLYLKYHNDSPVIRELQRVSAPGLRRYVKAREIPRVKNGLGMAILSTPQGLMTDREARTARVGGELRTLVGNIVDGVTKGFAKALEIQGVGYKAEPKAFGVQLVVGVSHPVPYHAPQGIKITVDNNVIVKIEDVDKELVGQVAAEIRAIRPPEPYKGKGVRYVGEQVRRKAGKTAQAAK